MIVTLISALDNYLTYISHTYNILFFYFTVAVVDDMNKIPKLKFMFHYMVLNRIDLAHKIILCRFVYET